MKSDFDPAGPMKHRCLAKYQTVIDGNQGERKVAMKACKGIFFPCMASAMFVFVAGCSQTEMKLDSVKKAPQEKIETPRLVVMGIAYSEDRRFAVIGKRTVQEGDEILGATVVRINRSSVEFEMDGKRWTQEVEGESK